MSDEMRELDAWIAEHVMGWKFTDRRAAGWGDGPLIWLTGDSNNPIYQGFSPTERPRDAMMVLEKCAKKVDQISMVECLGTWALVEGDGNETQASEADAPTLPLAICLFAKSLFEKGGK